MLLDTELDQSEACIWIRHKQVFKSIGFQICERIRHIQIQIPSHAY